MPTQPLGSAVEPLMRAVSGCVWARWDEQHRRLYVGRYGIGGWAVHTLDTITGEPVDNPWPVSPESVVLNGYEAAFSAAVAERMRQGY